MIEQRVLGQLQQRKYIIIKGSGRLESVREKISTLYEENTYILLDFLSGNRAILVSNKADHWEGNQEQLEPDTD